MKKLLLVVLLLVATNIFAQSYPEPVKYMFSGRDTVQSASDTMSVKIGTALKNKIGDWFGLIITADDTIQVSTDTNYTNKMIVYPNESLTTPKFLIKLFTNVYWKVLGTGSASVRYFFYGN